MQTAKLNMTTARKEAIRRWGRMAFVQSSRYHWTPMKGVGKWVITSKTTARKDYFGWGKTWEEAFDNATKKGK